MVRSMSARLFTRRQVVSLITAACRAYTFFFFLYLSLCLRFFSRQIVIIHRRSIPRTRRVSLVKSSNEYRSRWTLSGNLPDTIATLTTRIRYVCLLDDDDNDDSSQSAGRVIDRLNRACHAYRTERTAGDFLFKSRPAYESSFIHYLGDQFF